MRTLLMLLLVLSLCGCAAEPAATTTVPATTVPPVTVPETTVPETTVPPTTEAPNEFSLDGYSEEEIWTYFEEVVLHMEYSDGDGDPFRVQKWRSPIRCRIFGDPTEEDLAVLEDFFAELNTVPGFPGIGFAAEDEFSNLTLSFLSPEEFTEQFSEVVHGEDAVGATEFWYYTDTNELYDARIGYRTDLDQSERNSILLEEVVNTLGISDTELREDSIVYQYSNDNHSLSDMDWVILKLLYHPDMGCGMDSEECHSVLTGFFN